MAWRCNEALLSCLAVHILALLKKVICHPDVLSCVRCLCWAYETPHPLGSFPSHPWRILAMQGPGMARHFWRYIIKCGYTIECHDDFRLDVLAWFPMDCILWSLEGVSILSFISSLVCQIFSSLGAFVLIHLQNKTRESKLWQSRPAVYSGYCFWNLIHSLIRSLRSFSFASWRLQLLGMLQFIGTWY